MLELMMPKLKMVVKGKPLMEGKIMKKSFSSRESIINLVTTRMTSVNAWMMQLVAIKLLKKSAGD